MHTPLSERPWGLFVYGVVGGLLGIVVVVVVVALA